MHHSTTPATPLNWHERSLLSPIRLDRRDADKEALTYTVCPTPNPYVAEQQPGTVGNYEEHGFWRVRYYPSTKTCCKYSWAESARRWLASRMISRMVSSQLLEKMVDVRYSESASPINDFHEATTHLLDRFDREFLGWWEATHPESVIDCAMVNVDQCDVE